MEGMSAQHIAMGLIGLGMIVKALADKAAKKDNENKPAQSLPHQSFQCRADHDAIKAYIDQQVVILNIKLDEILRQCKKES